MNKYLSICSLALTIMFIAAATSTAHEGEKLSNEELASQIGRSASELKEIDEKIIAYNETIKSNPEDADAHFNLGVLYEKKMKFKDAISEYQQAIKIKPGFVDAHINLSLVYTERDMFGESINELKQVLKMDPQNVDAHKYLGRSYYKTGLLQDALVEFKKAL